MTTIGADPELFVTLDREPVSAYKLIPGTKEKPFKVYGGAVQVDGTALEFNIDPVKNKTDFIKNIEGVQNLMKEMVLSKGDYHFSLSSSVQYSQDVFAKMGEEEKAIGCEPDMNAYTFDMNPKTEDMITSRIRSAGGHIHIGDYSKEKQGSWEFFSDCARMSRLMDQELGVYSLLWDKDNNRRKTYGIPGSFREKEYGVEYRTLSNAWLSNKKLLGIVWDFTLDAVKKFKETDEQDVIDTTYREILLYNDTKIDFFKCNEKAERVMEAIA